jgi:hypothetical protein
LETHKKRQIANNFTFAMLFMFGPIASYTFAYVFARASSLLPVATPVVDRGAEPVYVDEAEPIDSQIRLRIPMK